MQEDTVKKLISNLEVLQGYVRMANVRVRALEDILTEIAGVHYERYRLLVLQYENDPSLFYPLEDVAGLQQALLRNN